VQLRCLGLPKLQHVSHTLAAGKGSQKRQQKKAACQAQSRLRKKAAKVAATSSMFNTIQIRAKQELATNSTSCKAVSGT
jgi:hypothetical protein